MASLPQWVAGARLRTLPAAITPVAVGTGVAAAETGVDLTRALLALIVALALQIGVNYANDYSDGVRGTDANRVGPFRLVGSGAATPWAVRAAAVSCFAVGAIAGLGLVAMTGTWWLLLVGAASLLAAWFYTGGDRPYGYRGFGELAVFVFFGVVAVVATAYVQTEQLTALAFAAAVPVGLLSCALLLANNLRDIPTDRAAGKRTLAVIVGDGPTRTLYTAGLTVAFVAAAGIAGWRPWALLALASAPLALQPVRTTLSGDSGAALIPVLKETGRLQLVFGVLLAVGLSL